MTEVASQTESKWAEYTDPHEALKDDVFLVEIDPRIHEAAVFVCIDERPRVELQITSDDLRYIEDEKLVLPTAPGGLQNESIGLLLAGVIEAKSMSSAMLQTAKIKREIGELVALHGDDHAEKKNETAIDDSAKVCGCGACDKCFKSLEIIAAVENEETITSVMREVMEDDYNEDHAIGVIKTLRTVLNNFKLESGFEIQQKLRDSGLVDIYEVLGDDHLGGEIRIVKTPNKVFARDAFAAHFKGHDSVPEVFAFTYWLTKEIAQKRASTLTDVSTDSSVVSSKILHGEIAHLVGVAVALGVHTLPRKIST